MAVRGDYRFNEWWVKHQHEFVSHATTNEVVILNEKTLKCAEEVFRTKGKVEHECSTEGVRHVAENFRALGNPFQIIEYWSREDMGCMMIPHFALSCGILKWLQQSYPDCEIEEKGSFVKVYSEGMNEAPNGCPQYDWDCLRIIGKQRNRSQPYSITHVHQLPQECQLNHFSPVGFREDENAGRKMDQTLRAMYQEVLAEGMCPNRSAFTFFQMRQEVFCTAGHRLASDVRVEKNGVRWEYGSTAILMGNPRPRLAWEGLFSEPRTNRREFHLLQPFQVSPEEGFYKVHLDDPAVMILCRGDAYDALHRNLSLDPEMKGRIVDFRTLTPDQQNFFDSPP